MQDSRAVTDYFIGNATAWWRNKRVNQSRKGTYAREYEIRLRFEGEDSFCLTKMSWAAHGAGRDVFYIPEWRLGLKVFQEAGGRWLVHQVEERDHEGWRRCIPEHLPVIYKRTKQQMHDHNGSLISVDTQLVQWIGPSLHSILKNQSMSTDVLEPEQKAQLRQHLLEIVAMTEVVHHKGLKWYGDFHSGNICRMEETGRWYLVDLEAYEPVSSSLVGGWKEAGNRLVRDIQADHSVPAGIYFRELLEKYVIERGPLDTASLRRRMEDQEGLQLGLLAVEKV